MWIRNGIDPPLLIPLFLLYHRVYIQALLEMAMTFIQNALSASLQQLAFK